MNFFKLQFSKLQIFKTKFANTQDIKISLAIVFIWSQWACALTQRQRALNLHQ